MQERQLLSAVAILALTGALAGCAVSEPGDSADLLTMLPASVDLVAFVDVRQLREQPLWQKVREDEFVQAGEDTLDQLKAATGLDPLRDFHMLLFAARNIGQEDMEMAVIARGDLNRSRLERMAAEIGWEPDSGSDLYSLPFSIEGSMLPEEMPDLANLRLAFLDDYTLAFGSEEILSGALGSGPRLVDSDDLGPLLHEGLGSGQFWGAFRAGYLSQELQSRMEEGIPLMGILKGFSGVAAVRFSLRFSDSIDLVARAHTNTGQDAQLLADTLTGFLELAKLAVAAANLAVQQPEILRFLEGALVGVDLDSVRISFNVDGATLERIRNGFFKELGGF